MANKRITELPAIGAFTGSELFEVIQGGVNKKATLTEVATYAVNLVTPFDLATATQRYNFDLNGTVAADYSTNFGSDTDINSAWTFSAAESTVHATGSNNSASFGWDHTVGDGVSSGSGANSFTAGVDLINNANAGFVSGHRGRITYVASTTGGFVHGLGVGYPSTVPYVTAAAGAINISRNTAAQTDGFGALAPDSFIIGGINGNVPITSPRSGKIGGGIYNFPASTPDYVAMPGIILFTTPDTDNALTSVFAYDPVVGKLKLRTAASLGGTAYVQNGNAFGAASSIGLTDNFALTLQTGTASLIFRTNGTDRARFLTDGKFLYNRSTAIGTEDFLLKGTGTSTGIMLRIINSSDIDTHLFRHNGAMALGVEGVAISPASGGSVSNSGRGILFSGAVGSQASDPVTFSFGTLSANNFDYASLKVLQTFGPSGAVTPPTYAGIRFLTVINQVSGSNGAIYAFDWNPTRTAVLGTEYGIIIRPTTCLNGFGTATPTRTVDVAGSVGLKAGGSAGILARAGGVIHTNITTTGNVGAGEDTLFTYSVPAATLNVDKDTIVGSCAGTFGASLNNKRIRVKFGATTIFDSEALAITAATDWALEFEIIRTGATTQKCNARLNTSSATLSAYCDYSTAAETLSGAVTLLVTGEATSDNDIVGEMLKIRWESSE